MLISQASETLKIFQSNFTLGFHQMSHARLGPGTSGYALGVKKRPRPAAHAGGRPVEKLLCWPFLKGDDCGCDGGCDNGTWPGSGASPSLERAGDALLHLEPRPCYIGVHRFLHNRPECDGTHAKCNGVHLAPGAVQAQVLAWLDERSAPEAPAATWGAAPDAVDISDWLAALAVTALPSDGGDGGDGGDGSDGGVATELTTTTTLTPTPTSTSTDGRKGGGVCGRKKRSIEFVLEHVLPLLGAGDSVTKRQGAIEAVTSILVSL